jgi:thiosulfate dehydrogenase [quinone] large subunit
MATSKVFSGWTDGQRAHFALRGILGVNIFTHGLVRITSPAAFAAKMSAGFAPTPLPGWMVTPFLTLLPFLELAVGLLILSGLRLRAGLMTGAALIAVLTFGSSMQQQWEVVGLQLIYGLAYYRLIATASDARLTLGAAS